MKYCERDFISAVAHIPGVVALRVEGLENIEFARRVAPEKFIVGLVKKKHGQLGTRITPEVADGYDVHNAGADMVATGCLHNWMRPLCDGICNSHGLGVPFRIMYDLGMDTFDALMRQKNGIMVSCMRKEIAEKNLILATTYEDFGIELLHKIKSEFPSAIVNLEGGVWNADMMVDAFYHGADYVTIGKAINDPAFITKKLLSECSRILG